MSKVVIVTFENPKDNQHSLLGGKQYQNQNFNPDYANNILVVVTYAESNPDHFTCIPYDSVKVYRDLHSAKPRPLPVVQPRSIPTPIVHVTITEIYSFTESIKKATSFIKEAITAYNTSIEKQNSGSTDAVPYSNYTTYRQDREKYIRSGPFYEKVNPILWDAVEYAFGIVKAQQTPDRITAINPPDFSQKIDEVKRNVAIQPSFMKSITTLLELVDTLYKAYDAGKRTNGVERVQSVSTNPLALIPPTTDSTLLESIDKAREFITKATDAYNKIIKTEKSSGVSVFNSLSLQDLGLDTYTTDAEREKKIYVTPSSIYKPIHEILWRAVDYAFYLVNSRNTKGTSTTIEEPEYLQQFNKSNVDVDESTKQAIIDVLTDVRTLHTSYITGKSTTDLIKNSGSNSTSSEKPLNEKPLNKKPLNEKPLNEKPLNEKPLNEKPLHKKPLTTEPLSNSEIVRLRKLRKTLRKDENQYEIEKTKLNTQQKELQKEIHQLVFRSPQLGMENPEIKKIQLSLETIRNTKLRLVTSIAMVKKEINNITKRLGKSNIIDSNSNNDELALVKKSIYPY